MGDKPSDKELVELTKEHQRENLGQEPDSSKAFARAGHAFRDDWQAEHPEDFPNRDRSDEGDTSSKEDSDDSNSSE